MSQKELYLILFCICIFNKLPLIETINTTNSTNSLISTNDIYSSDYKKIISQKAFKKYLTYDNTNNTEILYIEFRAFEEDESSLCFYNFLVYWFTNITGDDLGDIFYGISHTKKINTTEYISDLILCRNVYNLQKRCDDYYMKHSGPSIENDFYKAFAPNLDYLDGGMDNILNYDLFWLIENDINPYKSLIKFGLTLPSYNLRDKNSFDLELDFRNNFTIFFGSIGNNSSNVYDSPIFSMRRVVTTNYSELLLSSNYLQFYSIAVFLFIIILN
jgi:hypothetical protein